MRGAAPLPPKGTRLVVAIEALDDEGRGRALLSPDAGDEVRVDVAARGAFPGDRVEAVVERAFPARRLVVGRAARVLEAGLARVPRACPHLAPCVGCPLDGLDGGAQLALKRERVLRALDDGGLSGIEVDDVVPAPSAVGYRQKVKLVAGGRAGALRFGLFAPYSHYVVEADRCATHHGALVAAAVALKGALDDGRVPPHDDDARGVKALVMRAYREGAGAVVVAGAALPDETWRALAALVAGGALASVAERVDAGPGNSLLGGEITRAAGPRALTPLDGGAPCEVDAFCQADPVQALAMYRMVARFLVDDEGGGRVLDAYAGAGGFARAVLELSPTAHVTAVEQAPSCRGPLDALGLCVLAESVADALPSLAAGDPFAAVVADPPKRGLGDDARGLAALSARRFALVSCDPDAMARDLAALLAAGYRVVRMAPFDLFASTPEVEVVTLLERG